MTSTNKDLESHVGNLFLRTWEVHFRRHNKRLIEQGLERLVRRFRAEFGRAMVRAYDEKPEYSFTESFMALLREGEVLPEPFSFLNLVIFKLMRESAVWSDAKVDLSRSISNVIKTHRQAVLASQSASPAHPHAEAMALYAKDALTHTEPWKLWEIQDQCDRQKGQWIASFHSPLWHEDFSYRRKDGSFLSLSVKAREEQGIHKSTFIPENPIHDEDQTEKDMTPKEKAPDFWKVKVEGSLSTWYMSTGQGQEWVDSLLNVIKRWCQDNKPKGVFHLKAWPGNGVRQEEQVNHDYEVSIRVEGEGRVCVIMPRNKHIFHWI